MKSVKGFTLVELMVTIAVLAIGLSLAVPSFSNLVRSNQAESQNAALVTALNTARSEAVKRGTNVMVAPKDNSDWGKGWDVKVGALVLREYPPLEGASLSGPNGSVGFNSRGQLAGASIGTVESFAFRVGAQYCKLERDIQVNAMGRVAINSRSCP